MATKVQLSEQQFVVFELDGESYGVDIGRVQEIDRMQKITTVPEVPPYVEGIINLRGRVTPIVNLKGAGSLCLQRRRPPSSHCGCDLGRHLRSGASWMPYRRCCAFRPQRSSHHRRC